MKETRKTTKAEFKQFVKTCKEWQKTLGLMEYKLYFVHTDLGEDTQASVTLNVDGLWATLYLATETHKGNHGPGFIDSTAKHEMIHLLTARLEEYARSRYVTPDSIYAEVEIIARRLENVL